MLSFNNKKKYDVNRTCKDCKNVDAFPLTKVEAAFELFDSRKVWNSNCSICRSVNCDSTGLQGPPLDQELLDIWGTNLELTFMPQDEELLLAKVEYFPLLLKAIDEEKYVKRKLEILIESICVLLFDNTYKSEEFTKQENKERLKIAEEIRPELIKRKDKIKVYELLVMDYVKEVVFPQIGIDFDTRIDK